VIRYAIEYLRSLVKSERGQDLTEYALITGGVAIAAIVAVALLGRRSPAGHRHGRVG